MDYAIRTRRNTKVYFKIKKKKEKNYLTSEIRSENYLINLILYITN